MPWCCFGSVLVLFRLFLVLIGWCPVVVLVVTWCFLVMYWSCLGGVLVLLPKCCQLVWTKQQGLTTNEKNTKTLKGFQNTTSEPECQGSGVLAEQCKIVQCSENKALIQW